MTSTSTMIGAIGFTGCILMAAYVFSVGDWTEAVLWATVGSLLYALSVEADGHDH